MALREGWSLVSGSFTGKCEKKGSKEGCLKRGLVPGHRLICMEM